MELGVNCNTLMTYFCDLMVFQDNPAIMKCIPVTCLLLEVAFSHYSPLNFVHFLWCQSLLNFQHLVQTALNSLSYFCF